MQRLDTANQGKTDSLWGNHPANPRFTKLYHLIKNGRIRSVGPPLPSQIFDWQPDTTGYILITERLLPRDKIIIAERINGLNVSDPVSYIRGEFRMKYLEAKWHTSSGSIKKQIFDTKYLFAEVLKKVPIYASAESSYEVVDSVVCK